MKAQNNFLQNGPWEGFYLEFMQPGKYPMRIEFTFENGRISGYGSDPVGRHTWGGYYDTFNYHVQMVKTYTSHQINYKGHADENGIWGKWSLEKIPFIKEGFHIWPVNKGENSEKMSLEEKIEELKKKLVRM